MFDRNKLSKKQPPYIRSGTVTPPGLILCVSAGVLLIVAAVLLGYFPSLSGGFIFDDDLYVKNNLFLRASNGLYLFWFTTEPVDYYPVSNTLLWLEWRLWGMNPSGYHASNLILHIAEALLIWIILRKLSIPGAFLAATIFAVHPVNVESVAWIAQFKDMLGMLFFLLSIFWYLKFLCSRHTPCAVTAHTIPAHGVSGVHINCWYWLSLAAYATAMLSKGSVAVLPVVLVGIIWWLRGKKGTGPLSEKGPVPFFSSVPFFSELVWTVPFFAVAAVFTLVHVWFQTHGTGNIIRNAGIIERLLGAGGVVWFYLYKAVLPLNLAFMYPEWHIEAGNPLWWLPLLTVLAVTAALWLFRESWSRPFLFAWGFFCVALVPVMGFVDTGFMQYSLVADHYQHIALIGIIALAAGLWSLWQKHAKGAARGAATALAMGTAGVFTLLTYQQSELYRNTITLYEDTLAKNPECWAAYNNLGKALFDKGQLQEAFEHYNKALSLKSDYPEAHNNLGVALFQTGRRQEAIEHYNQVLRINPKSPDTYYNLGIVFMAEGQYEQAVKQYEQTIRLKPIDYEAHDRLGMALTKLGRFEEAIDHYEKALHLNPDFAQARANLGFALVQAGRPKEAIEHYEQILRLKPDNVDAHNMLSAVLNQLGRPGEAIEHGEQVLRLKPDYPEAHYNLGNALFQTGRLPEGIEHYEQALRLKPDYPEAHNNLGLALLRQGQVREAIKNYEQVVRLKPDYLNAYHNLALAYARARQSSEAVAAAKKALELARTQGQAAKAKEIEDWLNSYEGRGKDE